MSKLFALSMIVAYCGCQPVNVVTSDDAGESLDATVQIDTGIYPDDAGVDGDTEVSTPACTWPLAPTAIFNYAPFSYWHAVHVLADGDSLTAAPYEPLPDGGLYPGNQNSNAIWVPLLSYLLGTEFFVEDVGYGGITCTELAERASSVVDPKIDPTRPNLLTIACGPNDVVGYGVDGGTPALLDPVIDTLESYCDERRAAGWLVALPTPSYSGYYTSDGYAHYVARIRAECPQHADACPDLAADPRLNHYDLHWFYDSTHLSQNGYVARAFDMIPSIYELGRGAVDAGTWESIAATQ